METDTMTPRRHALPLLAFFSLSGLSLWPAIQAPFTRVVGVAHLHVWEELWHFWWTRTALLTGRSPFVTDALGFPRGMNVFYDMSSLSLPLASVPLQGLLGVVGTYNAMAFFALTAAAFGAYLLCYRLSGTRLSAMAGGVVFGFSPFLQTELSNGMMENLFAFALLPYFVLALLRMNRTGRPRDGFVAGLMAAFATLSSWYFLVMAALLSLLFFLAPGRATPDVAQDKHGAAPAPEDRAHRFRAYLVMALTVTVIIAWPLIVLGRGPTLERGIPWQDCVRGPLTQKSCIDVLSLFTHGRATSPASPEVAAGDETLELLPFGVYIGKVTLLLVALALLIPRTARSAARTPDSPCASRDAPVPLFWIVGFLLVVLLMLGPYLNINGRVTWGGLRIPLLNRLLLVLPGTGRVLALHNYRFASCVMLFAAVLASCSLARLLAGISRRRLRIGFALAVTWLILVDSGHSRARDHFLFLPVSDATLPTVFTAIADEPDGAIFNIPVSSGAHARPDIRGLQMFHQLAHGRPIPCDPIYEIEPPADEIALAGAARAMALRTPWDLDEQVLARDLEQLAARGFRLVAIYPSFLAAEDETRIRALVRRRLGPPLASDGTIELYRLAPHG